MNLNRETARNEEHEKLLFLLKVTSSHLVKRSHYFFYFKCKLNWKQIERPYTFKRRPFYICDLLYPAILVHFWKRLKKKYKPSFESLIARFRLSIFLNLNSYFSWELKSLKKFLTRLNKFFVANMLMRMKQWKPYQQKVYSYFSHLDTPSRHTDN